MGRVPSGVGLKARNELKKKYPLIISDERVLPSHLNLMTLGLDLLLSGGSDHRKPDQLSSSRLLRSIPVSIIAARAIGISDTQTYSPVSSPVSAFFVFLPVSSFFLSLSDS